MFYFQKLDHIMQTLSMQLKICQNSHSWPKATLHNYGLPPLASPSCIGETRLREEDNLHKVAQKFKLLYPGGAVGHLNSAVTEPRNRYSK